jgi:hypothetical protein
MAASRISAIVAIAGAAITATSVVPITSDFATPTTYKMTMAQLRTALFAGVSGYAASDILSIGAAAPAAGIVRLDGGTQAGASSVPIISAVQTWNNGTTVFSGWLLNITNTASAAASLLMDLQVGGVSQFKVSKAGVMTVAGTSALQAVTATQTSAGATVVTITSAESGTATTLLAFQRGDTLVAGAIRYLISPTNIMAFGTTTVHDAAIMTGNTLAIRVNGSTQAVTIASGLTVSNGNVNVGTLPTSAGATGTLYSVAGVVHVS